MSGDLTFQYYYGMEAEQYSFYRIPKVLITDPRFRILSTDAKLLYGLMLDRMSLSVRNGWLDEESRVYIYYPIEEIMGHLGCKNDKAIKTVAELDSIKGIGLIERIRQGQGRPAIIYVKRFIIDDDIKRPSKSDIAHWKGRSQDIGKAEMKASEKPSSRTRKNRDQDIGDIEAKASDRSNCGYRKNRSQDIGKTHANNTESNNTERNNPDPSFYPARLMEPVIDVDGLRAEIRESIQYGTLRLQYGREDLDGIVELILETLCRKSKTVRIAGADYPAALVRERFRKIGQFEVEYVLDCLERNTTKVYNIKSYLLTALYNAPVTNSPYHRAEVNHHFSQEKERRS